MSLGWHDKEEPTSSGKASHGNFLPDDVDQSNSV